MVSLLRLKRTLGGFAALLMALQFVSTTPCFADFVKVRPFEGLWWFTDSSGKTFLSRGVDNVNFYQDFIQDTKVCPYSKASLDKYKTQGAWRQAIAARLLSLNFNTLGAWSDDRVAQEDVTRKSHLYYTIMLSAADSFDEWNHSGLPDFYDPKFEQSVKKTAEKVCAAHKDDEKLLGYFTDNEMPWVNLNSPLLVQYLNKPDGTPGKGFAFSFLKLHYPTFSEFNRVWETNCQSWSELQSTKIKFTASRSNRDKQEQFERDCNMFAGFAATRYFEVVSLAIKAVDPNHLNLGCRFSEYPGLEILRACTAHTDVISFNCYEVNPEKTITKYEASGKPLLIGEFSFRGVDSGLPNTKGAGPIVTTQKLRGDYFAAYVKTALKSPMIVGYHWFEHIDEPKQGRFDGENSNYGLADINDEPYMELSQSMKQINAQAQSLHAKAEQF